MSDTQIKLLQRQFTYDTIRPIRKELEWANEAIADYAKAAETRLLDEDERFGEVDELLPIMQRAIDGALREIDMAGLAFAHDLLDLGMFCDAIGSDVDAFWRNSHVVAQVRAHEAGCESASDKAMLEYSKRLIHALRFDKMGYRERVRSIHAAEAKATEQEHSMGRDRSAIQAPRTGDAT